MNARWWSPDGPTIGLDAQDQTLLTPLGDARADLGAALLAHHRVGAGACLMAAQSPLVDERALVEYLALARQSYAPPLVESIAKSVGEGPYAGLLVRDLADEGERAAVDLFRAAVAKGVSPPLAAQRCAMVYGVPADELGAFRTLALIPQSTPLALADAADRVLFAAVEKAAGEELEHADTGWEPVSKAPTAEEPRRRTAFDDPETPYYDARGDDGRFTVAYGDDEDGYAGPAVGTPPRKKALPTRRQAGARSAGSLRRTQGAKGIRAQARPAAPAAAPKAAERVARPAERRAAGTERARLGLTREPMTATQRALLEEGDDQQPDLAPIDWAQGRYDERIGGFHQPYAAIDDELGIALSPSAYKDLLPHLGRTTDGKRRFRMGHVASEAAPEYLMHGPLERSEHAKRLDAIAAEGLREAEDKQGYTRPDSFIIKDSEAQEMGTLALQEEVMGLKYDMADDHLQMAGVDPVVVGREQYQRFIEQLVQRIIPTRLPDNSGDAYTLMHKQAAQVNVIEFIVEGGARGNDDGTRHAQVELDPNQMWVIQNDRPDRIYDPEIGAWRLRYYLRPDWDDDFDKADRTFVETDVVRDRLGRFAEEPDQEVQVPVKAKSTRAQAKPARRRGLRAQAKPAPKVVGRRDPAPAVRAPLSSGRAPRTLDRRRLELSRSLQAALQRAEQEQLATVTALVPYRSAVELKEDNFYSVYGQEEFQSLVDMLGESKRFEAGFQRAAVTAATVRGKAADARMKDMTNQELLREQYGTPYNTLKVVGDPLVLSEDEDVDRQANRIHAHIREAFNRNPDVQQIVLTYDHDGGVTLLGNAIPAEPVVLVEHADDLDTQRPMELRYVDRKVYDQLIPTWAPINDMLDLKLKGADLSEDEEAFWSSDDMLHSTLLPTVITRPKVDHYRLVNSSDEDWL